MRTLVTIKEIEVTQDDSNVIEWVSGLTCDCDGANGLSRDETGKPMFCYAPGDKGLDYLANAGYPRYPDSFKEILVCDDEDVPIIQRINAVTGYISRTAYEHRWASNDSPERFVDAYSVCYGVTNPLVRVRAAGIVLGARMTIEHTGTGKIIECVVADVSGSRGIGEASVAAARALGVNPSPRNGGDPRKIFRYRLYAGTPAPGFELQAA